jgi:hypothetical protein
MPMARPAELIRLLRVEFAHLLQLNTFLVGALVGREEGPASGIFTKHDDQGKTTEYFACTDEKNNPFVIMGSRDVSDPAAIFLRIGFANCPGITLETVEGEEKKQIRVAAECIVGNRSVRSVGHTGDIVIVTALQLAGGVLQQKTRVLTLVDGIITMGDESAWADVPSA